MIPLINIASDTFNVWVQKTNQTINVFNSLSPDGVNINSNVILANTVNAALYITVGGVDVGNTLNAVFTLANTNANADNLAFNTANVAFNTGNTAFAKANSSLAKANNLSDLANVSISRQNLGLGTIATQNANSVAITGGSITGMPTPSNPTDVVIKSYADAIAAGLTFKDTALLATTSNLNVTYVNLGGVGDTLTNAGSLANFSLDGVTPNTSSRILVKNQTNQIENGIYTVTTNGSVSLAWVLTRSSDYNQTADVAPGDLIPVQSGNTNYDTVWLQTSNVSAIGTSNIIFQQFVYGPSTFLQANNNLSDLPNTATALTNLGLVAAQQSSIAGFIPTAISGTSTTAAVTISAGQAADSTAATYISTSGNTSWAVSNGNAINGYAGGTTLPNSSTIHFFACSGGSGTGTFASTSLTPTFPTGYTTYSRRIFSLRTNSSGALISGVATETAGGGFQFNMAAITDYSSTAGQAATLESLSVPTGIVVFPLQSFSFTQNASGDSNVYVGPGANSAITIYVDAPNLPSQRTVSNIIGPPTNTSGQIYLTVTILSGSLVVGLMYTNGWIDARRN